MTERTEHLAAHAAEQRQERERRTVAAAAVRELVATGTGRPSAAIVAALIRNRTDGTDAADNTNTDREED